MKYDVSKEWTNKESSIKKKLSLYENSSFSFLQNQLFCRYASLPRSRFKIKLFHDFSFQTFANSKQSSSVFSIILFFLNYQSSSKLSFIRGKVKLSISITFTLWLSCVKSWSNCFWASVRCCVRSWTSLIILSCKNAFISWFKMNF